LTFPANAIIKQRLHLAQALKVGQADNPGRQEDVMLIGQAGYQEANRAGCVGRLKNPD
jgi:hypothetical protein